MFTKGFQKTAFQKTAIQDPDPRKAAAAMRGMNMPVGQQLTQGWANIKNELGFGGSNINTGKMGK